MSRSLRAARAGALELRPWGLDDDAAPWVSLAPGLEGRGAVGSTTLRWDDRHAALGLAPLTLFEQTPYLLVLAPGRRLAGSFEAPRVAADADGRSLHALTLRGHVGRVVLRAGDDAMEAEVSLRREGAADDWRAMLDELCAADLALASRVDAVSDAALALDPVGRRRTPTEELLLLQHLLRSGALREALDAIAREPATAVATHVHPVALDRATRAHPDELVARGAQARAVAREPGPSLTRDVAENRFVAACLADLTAAARALAGPRSPLRDRALRGLAREVLASFESLREAALRGPLVGVSEARGERRVTVALQRRRGYREVLAAWQSLHASPRASALVGEETVGLADAPRLYERWCGLQLARAVDLADEEAVRFAAGGCVARVAAPGADVTLASQASGRSYGLSFRPDFVLRAGGRALVFDAKYQVDDVEARAPREALVKMHAYRDAIAGVEAAWALFPGARSERWEAPGGGGVGALALRPGGGGDAALRGVIEAFLLASGGRGEGKTRRR